MKRKQHISPPAVGGSSLLVIFGILCLTVFAMLSLSTVEAERRLSEASAQAVTDYYGAELRAQEIFARLRAGEAGLPVEQEDDLYHYSLPISSRQRLVVTLRQEDDTWTVLRWQTVTQESEWDDSLPVWKGNEEDWQ